MVAIVDQQKISLRTWKLTDIAAAKHELIENILEIQESSDMVFRVKTKAFIWNT